MSDIPSEVFREILLRLPAVSVFQFRSVCKTWLQMIDDPSFIRAHANNQVYSHTVLVRNKTGAPIYFFSLDSLNFTDGPQRIEATRIKQLIRPGVPRLPDLYRVPTCNGLILLSHENIKKIWAIWNCNGLILLSHENIKKIWAIWNPLTGDCHELPQPNASLNKDSFGLGFGYDCDDDDDDKVVSINRLSSAEKDVYQTLVYSLKSGSWSMIEGCPEFHFLFNPGVFLNGTLYWESLDIIVALDLRAETYFQLPLPPKDYRSKNCGTYSHARYLDALDGCLIFSMSYRHCYDGWMMKDNGVEKTWIKLFSIRFSIGSSLFHDPWRSKLVAYLKSKRQVVLQNNRGFLWFGIDKNSILKFSSHRFLDINSSQICSGSLVRLNACASTGVVAATKTSTRKRKRTTKKPYTRLKICVTDLKDDECSCFDDEERFLETSEDD